MKKVILKPGKEKPLKNRHHWIFSGAIAELPNFDNSSAEESIIKHLDAAFRMRKELFAHSNTNGYRLVNGEGDNLPGLIIDKYDQVIVIQFSTLGMEQFRELIVNHIKKEL